MNDFRLFKLSDLVSRVKVGFVGSINKYYCGKEDGIPLIRTTDLTDIGINYSNLKFVTKEFHKKNKKSRIKKGDLIIARHGENGKANIFNEDFEAQVLNAVIIEPSNKLSPSLIKLFFETQFVKKQILGDVKGSVQGVINTSHIANLKIPISPKINYSQISKLLDSISKKIELNNRINAELEAMAKLVYEYLFVQFDFPDQNDKPYKSSGGKMVWNEELKREIPEGWEVHPVDYWIQNDKNGDWGKEEIEGNYDLRVSCIRGADINGLNGNGELKSPVRYILEKNSHKILEPEDLVIEISGGSPTQSTGRLGYIINETLERFNEPLICSNFCKAITLKDESNLFNFIYEWKRLYEAGIFFGYEGKTSGIKNFLFESFVSKHKIVIPPQELTEKFYEKVLPIHSKIQKNLIQNQELSTLRDWLLPMLMNGQVRVAEAEERVEEELGLVAERERERYFNE